MSTGGQTYDAAASREGCADSAGVRIHYRAFGDRSRPLLICLHGFPDDSRTWRPIVPFLTERFFVVTPDLRGYTRSDKPDGVQNYRMEKLVGDVVALIEHLGREKAILIGHDWGAAIAQNVAVHHPHRVERLILLNMPHINGLLRELSMNPRQQKASLYARLFQDEVPLGPFDFDTLQRQLRGIRDWRQMLEVLRDSDLSALLNYYRANYPRPPYTFTGGSPRHVITVPTLIIYGLQDPFVLAECLHDNGRWFTHPLKVVTLARAGHWVHHDEADVVAGNIVLWLGA